MNASQREVYVKVSFEAVEAALGNGLSGIELFDAVPFL
jgi:hypothetical protein